MKKFEAPAMDVEKLQIMDVIATSATEAPCDDDNDMGEF